MYSSDVEEVRKYIEAIKTDELEHYICNMEPLEVLDNQEERIYLCEKSYWYTTREQIEDEFFAEIRAIQYGGPCIEHNCNTFSEFYDPYEPNVVRWPAGRCMRCNTKAPKSVVALMKLYEQTGKIVL